MESSDAETGMVDSGVGTIVWVRRRNGSWWPGKILGPVELSASHLMSPRSGTPVKLLGREDASVDWYNLEKSKRVKPFRCGEFDECIERAEASQGMPPKKREKYARREDAILHALELEKKYGGKSKGIIIAAAEGASSRMSDGDGLSKNVLEKKRKRLQEEEERLSKRRVVESKYPPSSSYDNDTAVVSLMTQDNNNNNPATAASESNEEDTETDSSSGTESVLSDTYDSMTTAAADALLGEEDVEFIPKAAFGEEEEDASTSDDESGGDDSLLQKWQLKGKRNTRTSSSSYMNAWMKDEIHVHPPCLHVSRMIDVEVGVQSGYQREHVPMISLMSKLNDQAIVGHPIPVETLEDRTSDYILLSASADNEYLQPWRTARRTPAKCRLPPHVSALDDYYLVDNNNKRTHKSKKLRTSASSCNQKIRTLSSIGGNHHHHHHSKTAGEEGGVMKPEALPTAVACIPVKLVFSRLHEELVARHQ